MTSYRLRPPPRGSAIKNDSFTHIHNVAKVTTPLHPTCVASFMDDLCQYFYSASDADDFLNSLEYLELFY